MLEKDINELLQDYKYRKSILEEITLDDIDKWNNIELEWDNILNKPTDLEGYGLTEEMESNYLKVVNGEVKNSSSLKWVGTSVELSSNYNSGMDYAKLVLGNCTLDLSVNGYDWENKTNLYSNVNISDGIKLFSHRGVILGNNTTLYTGYRGFNDDESDLFPIVQESNDELLFGSTKIPNKMNNTLKLPRVNLYNSSNVKEGSLYNSTYNINGNTKDGIHLRHEDGKYLVLGYLDNTVGENGTVYSYMICDVDGVLKTGTEGDEWAPIRFEQTVYCRSDIKMGALTDIKMDGGYVGERLSSLENALEMNTGMVEWTNVLNKPSTFTPSTHSHAISDIASLQSALDGKASSNHNHDGSYLKLSGGTLTNTLYTKAIAIDPSSTIWFNDSDGVNAISYNSSDGISIGSSSKILNLNCTKAYLNGDELLTRYNYASYVLPKVIFAGTFSPKETIGTNQSTFYGYVKQTIYKSADCTVNTDNITLTNAGTYKVTVTWGGTPTSGTPNTSAMTLYVQQYNSTTSVKASVSGITVTSLNRKIIQTNTYLFKCSANDYLLFFSYQGTVTFTSIDIEIVVERLS